MDQGGPSQSHATSGYSSTPLSQGVSGVGSYRFTHDSVDRSLAFEWEQNNAFGVPAISMLDSLFPDAEEISDLSSFDDLKDLLIQAVSLTPEPLQYSPFANVCNTILNRWYDEHPPTETNPAVIFVPLGNKELEGKARRKPDILVVRLQALEAKLHLSKLHSESAKDLKALGLFPKLEEKDVAEKLPYYRDKKNAYAFSQEDLDVLGIKPLWESTVAVLEFKIGPAPFNCPPAPKFNSEPAKKRLRSATDHQSRSSAKSQRTSSSSSRVPSSPSAGVPTSTTLPILTQGSRNPSSSSVQQSPITLLPPPIIHPTSSKKTKPHVQLLGYFTEMFSGLTYRDWVSGAILNCNTMYLISCDREGAIVSWPIELKEQEGFRVFVRWVLTLGTRNLSQWGFSNLFESPGANSALSSATLHAPIDIQILKKKESQYGAFGRCTNIFEVEATTKDGPKEAICKVSWQPETRKNEHWLIKKARMVNDRNTPEVLCSWEMDVGVPSRRLQPLCIRGRSFEKRVVRAIVMSPYHPLHELKGEEFLDAFTQIVRCYVELHEKGCVHHRDPSITNMMYYKNEGRIVGILNDFDLAIPMDRQPGEISSRTRSGTLPFMARRILDGRDAEQTLEHDFESMLYILVWVALGYKGWEAPKGDPLQAWRRGLWQEVAEKKLAFLFLTGNYHNILEKILPEYKVLRQPIQRLRIKLTRQVMRDDDPSIGDFTAEQFFQCISDEPPPS